MEIAGYSVSVLIGVSLGLIGGGGSILTVPVLVYLFSIDPILGTAYSLFIVGITSAFGSWRYFRENLVSFRTAAAFGIPSVFAVFFARAVIVPAIPNEVFNIGTFTITKSILLMLLFSGLMVAASFSMIKNNQNQIETESAEKINYPRFFLQGITVGTFTGMVGAGGGFLIIPALIFLGKLPMKKAVGTSLVIIAAQSLIGFFSVQPEGTVDWIFLLKITAFAVAGIFVGAKLSTKIDGKKLKPAFGWFVLTMGVYIIIKELIIH